MNSSTIGILTGPTATGKTSLALELSARAGDMEIINADSMLVYRGMDIGTAKPTPGERAGTPHHLIDIRDPDESFTAGDFVSSTNAAIEEIRSRGRKPLIVGGTGFYLKALLHGLWEAPRASPELRKELERKSNRELYEELEKWDSAAAGRITPADRYRLIRALEIIRETGKTPTELQASQPAEPDPRFRLWVIDRDNEILHQRILERTRLMLEGGLIEEVERIRARYPEARSLAAVGYAQVSDYLDRKTPAGRKMRPGLPGLQDEIELATRQLVKRQRTWFRAQRGAKNFHLDADRPALEKEFLEIYGNS